MIQWLKDMLKTNASVAIIGFLAGVLGAVAVTQIPLVWQGADGSKLSTSPELPAKLEKCEIENENLLNALSACQNGTKMDYSNIAQKDAEDILRRTMADTGSISACWWRRGGADGMQRIVIAQVDCDAIIDKYSSMAGQDARMVMLDMADTPEDEIAIFSLWSAQIPDLDMPVLQAKYPLIIFRDDTSPVDGRLLTAFNNPENKIKLVIYTPNLYYPFLTDPKGFPDFLVKDNALTTHAEVDMAAARVIERHKETMREFARLTMDAMSIEAVYFSGKK